MNQQFQILYRHFCSGEIDRFEFIQALKSAGDFADDLLSELERKYAEKDWQIIPALVGAIYLVPSRKFAPLLCELLDKHRNGVYMQEIAWLALDIQDERMVPSLIRTLDYHDAGDADHHFNRNVVSALNAIGTPEAIEGIKLAAQSPHEPIREDAEKYLRQHQLL